MLLHIKLTGLSDETLGSKIRRAIFRNSSVPVKKKVTLAMSTPAGAELKLEPNRPLSRIIGSTQGLVKT